MDLCTFSKNVRRLDIYTRVNFKRRYNSESEIMTPNIF